MHNINYRRLFPVAAALAAMAGGASTTHAQSADALIDKLVDKGVLTLKEAKDLREEADKGYDKAYQVKSGMPDWVTTFKIGGDFRGRYDGLFTPDATAPDRHRFRYRLRVGGVATIKDDIEVGFRLTSSESSATGGDPISGNASFQDNGSKKFIFIDQAYAKWKAFNNPDFSLVTTIGKMENPFVFSEMVFDPDYTPEGAALNFTYNITQTQSIKFNTGAFVLDETGGDANDPFMTGVQLRWDAAWTPKIQSSVGAALLNIVSAKKGLVTASVPDVNSGNSRTAGVLDETFSTMVLDASATYMVDKVPFYNGPFPIKASAEYMENLAESNRNHGYGLGVTFGKSGKRGLWDVSYRWKELQGDVWYEELVDSDFGGYHQTTSKFASATGYRPGTNLRGHVIKLQYSPFDALTLAGTAFIANVIDTAAAGGVAANFKSDVIRLQVDAVFKF